MVGKNLKAVVRYIYYHILLFHATLCTCSKFKGCFVTYVNEMCLICLVRVIGSEAEGRRGEGGGKEGRKGEEGEGGKVTFLLDDARERCNR
jgi:hypothetical protein